MLFDHRHHVRDDGIDCLYCHDGAERSRVRRGAGVGCLHGLSQPDLERQRACSRRVRDSVATGRADRWQRVHSLPDFVYFDHSIHVAQGHRLRVVSRPGRRDGGGLSGRSR